MTAKTKSDVTAPAAAQQAAWQVYIVRCADGSLYTGIARDLVQRLAAHNDGTGASYTRARRPVTLVYSEAAPDRSTASKREYAIKQLDRDHKLALVAAARWRPAAALKSG